MAVLLADVKSYLRIDHTDDDTMLADLLEAASDYITSLVVTPGEGEEQPTPVDMAVKIMTAHLYENRLPSGSKFTGELPYSVSALIASYRDWDGDDDT
jgi:uncharacterized phage protein (predicted DNA packaging)